MDMVYHVSQVLFFALSGLVVGGIYIINNQGVAQ